MPMRDGLHTSQQVAVDHNQGSFSHVIYAPIPTLPVLPEDAPVPPAPYTVCTASAGADMCPCGRYLLQWV